MRLPLLIAAAFCLAACDGEPQPPLIASDIVIIAALPGQAVSAGYISLTNNTDVAISISRVVSPDFAAIEIHATLLEDGIAKMRRIDELSIPAHSTVALQSGGKHLMLMQPRGTTGQASLAFFDGDTLLLSVTVPLTTRND